MRSGPEYTELKQVISGMMEPLKKRIEALEAGQPQSPTEDEITDFLCDTQDRLGPGCDERAIAQALLRTYAITRPLRDSNHGAPGVSVPVRRLPE